LWRIYSPRMLRQLADVRPSLSLQEKEGRKNVLNPLSATGEEKVVDPPAGGNDRVSKYTSDINANARPTIPITLYVILQKLFRKIYISS